MQEPPAALPGTSSGMMTVPMVIFRYYNSFASSSAGSKIRYKFFKVIFRYKSSFLQVIFQQTKAFFMVFFRYNNSYLMLIFRYNNSFFSSPVNTKTAMETSYIRCREIDDDWVVLDVKTYKPF